MGARLPMRVRRGVLCCRDIVGRRIGAAKVKKVVAVGAVILALACVKVHNELRMTAMYERQAVALERIVGAMETGTIR